MVMMYTKTIMTEIPSVHKDTGFANGGATEDDDTIGNWLKHEAPVELKKWSDALMILGVSWRSFRAARDGEEDSIVQDLMAGGIPLLASRDIVTLAREELKKKEAPMAIFWDLENMPVPAETSGQHIASRIKSILAPHGTLKEFRAYSSMSGNTQVSAQQQQKWSELHLSGCHLMECPRGRKETADKMMIVDAMQFAYENLDAATLCFITSDIDFAYLLSVLQKRAKQWKIIVVSAASRILSTSQQNHQQAPSLLHTTSHVQFCWEKDVLGQQLPATIITTMNGRDGYSDPVNYGTTSSFPTTTISVSAESDHMLEQQHGKDQTQETPAHQNSNDAFRRKGREVISNSNCGFDLDDGDNNNLLRLLQRTITDLPCGPSPSYSSACHCVLKSRVGGTLRMKYPHRFPNRESVQRIFTLAIEAGFVLEHGNGPTKTLSVPPSSQESSCDYDGEGLEHHQHNADSSEQDPQTAVSKKYPSAEHPTASNKVYASKAPNANAKQYVCKSFVPASQQYQKNTGTGEPNNGPVIQGDNALAPFNYTRTGNSMVKADAVEMTPDVGAEPNKDEAVERKNTISEANSSTEEDGPHIAAATTASEQFETSNNEQTPSHPNSEAENASSLAKTLLGVLQSKGGDDEGQEIATTETTEEEAVRVEDYEKNDTLQDGEFVTSEARDTSTEHSEAQESSNDVVPLDDEEVGILRQVIKRLPNVGNSSASDQNDDESGHRVLKANVRSELRMKHSTKFQDGDAVQHFLERALKTRLVTEGGSGARRVISWGCEVVDNCDEPPIAEDKLPEHIKEKITYDWPFSIFILWKDCPKVETFFDSANVHSIGDWVVLLLQSESDAQRAVKRRPWLSQGSLFDWRKKKSFKFAEGSIADELANKFVVNVGRTTRIGRESGSAFDGTRAVLELLYVMILNDDIFVAEGILEKQLMLRWPCYCRSLNEATTWIDHAVESDYVRRFTRSEVSFKGRNPALLCLAPYFAACLAPFPTDNSDTLEEEEYVIGLLSRNHGAVRRSVITALLKDTFTSMQSPFMRKKMFRNAESNGSFTVEKIHHGHMVGMTKQDAWDALNSLAPEFPAEDSDSLMWMLLDEKTSDQNWGSSSVENEAPKNPWFDKDAKKKRCRTISRRQIIQRVLELLHILAQNDEIYISEMDFRIQLISSCPDTCPCEEAAQAWIEQAVECGSVISFIRDGVKGISLCLPQYETEAREPASESNENIDTSEVENYVADLLDISGGAIRRTALTQLLKDNFAIMSSRSTRNALYSNAKANGSFFIARNHKYHVVGSTKDAANKTLRRLSKETPDIALNFLTADPVKSKDLSSRASGEEVMNVVELLGIMADNDDLYVAEEIFAQQLMLRWPNTCTSSSVAASWMDQAVECGQVIQFRRNDVKSNLLCLPSNHAACLKPFPPDPSDTSEEEAFVVNLLRKNNGVLERTTVTRLLADKFKSMEAPFMRKKMYINAQSKGAFFVAKLHYGHVVGLAKQCAWYALNRMKDGLEKQVNSGSNSMY